MNMSYCRFQNTLTDLKDCYFALDEVLNGGEFLSQEELRAATSLIITCEGIVDLIKAEVGINTKNQIQKREIEKLLKKHSAENES